MTATEIVETPNQNPTAKNTKTAESAENHDSNTKEPIATRDSTEATNTSDAEEEHGGSILKLKMTKNRKKKNNKKELIGKIARRWCGVPKPITPPSMMFTL
jgi:hypothetical protein